MISTDNQVNHAALLHDAPGPHPDDQACQAKAQKQFGGAWAQGPQAAPPNCFLGFGSGFGIDFFENNGNGNGNGNFDRHIFL